eukprot:Protomagalhaensia_sp_Gyna_25__5741@NODE_829_length_2540_cov_324_240704_g653_i0_p1_GENE_NODE_829_length_2540_cov_324_240704_g653_i0NODE_829_length_2540_cov_324_240704_g653_i0_p1_ORF_typecomplete_len364_score65_04NAP/PF00956_18/7_6e48_NODE_829_length_2540_cov_324_240704_g653_i014082499
MSNEETWLEFNRTKMDAAWKEVEEERRLTPEAMNTLDRLIKLHIDQLAIESKYRQEWVQLKLKYYNQLSPFFNKRLDVLRQPNERPPTTTPSSNPNDRSNQLTSLSVPDFWLVAMNNHPVVAATIGTHDEPILKHIEDIIYDWENGQEQLGFSITFKFADNPFFSNKELVKKFGLEQDPETFESILTKSIGTKIDWKPGKDVTVKTVTKQQRNKREYHWNPFESLAFTAPFESVPCYPGTGDIRMVKKNVERVSFFHFFDSHEIPPDSVLDAMDDRDVRSLENILELEYEVGCILRDKIISHAVGWYLGVEVDDEEESCSSCESDSLADSEEDELEEDENEGGGNNLLHHTVTDKPVAAVADD